MIPKVTAAHLRRAAAVYCRQSTLIQLERNRESTLRQYDLVSRAGALGWPRSAIRVIDTDLGVSGSGLAVRAGFTELTEQIALGQVGVVLALEVSRLARSSAEWYRLLDLCGITDTPGAPWRIRLTGSIRTSSPTTPRRLGPRPGRHRIPGRLPADRVAACQARRTTRRPHPRRPQERPAHRATRPPRRAVLAIPRQSRSSVMPNRLGQGRDLSGGQITGQDG